MRQGAGVRLCRYCRFARWVAAGRAQPSTERLKRMEGAGTFWEKLPVGVPTRLPYDPLAEGRAFAVRLFPGNLVKSGLVPGRATPGDEQKGENATCTVLVSAGMAGERVEISGESVTTSVVK